MDLDLQDGAFSDPDLDDIPVNTFKELEEQAIQASQRPPIINAQQRHRAPLSDYGLEDEDDEVINLDDPQSRDRDFGTLAESHFRDELTEREQWRRNRYSDPASRPAFQHDTVTGPNTQPLGVTTAEQRYNETAAKNGFEAEEANGVLGDFGACQARIEELEREKANLMRAAEDAKSTVLSKTGEIAIVRSNHDKAQKEYERRMIVMQKLHVEELQKQKAELDIMRKEREKVQTDNRFLEHSLAEEARTRAVTKKAPVNGDTYKAHGAPVASPLSTPKRNKDKAIPFRDGFDDEEIFFMSPTKAKEKSKSSTPRAGPKRKRSSADDSPLQAFDLVESGIDIPVDDVVNILPVQSSPVQIKDVKYEVMSLILNHRNVDDGTRTIERLTQHHFPSQPTRTVAAMLYDTLGRLLQGQLSANEATSTICDALLQLWGSCLEETYYEPLCDLTTILADILLLSKTTLTISLLPNLVQKCLATIDLVAMPTVKTSNGNNNVGSTDLPLLQHIDPADYLSMLDLLSAHCASPSTHLHTFWSLIPFEFPLLMLHRAQPLHLITSTLHLLASSILPTSFGPILAPTATTSHRTKKETDLLDRLIVLLFELPSPPPSSHDHPHSPLTLLTLRADVLALLTQLCLRSPHGGRLLATHRYAFGRLARLLHELVTSLYAVRRGTHALAARCVNATVLLLAHLTACHADVLDVRARLAAVPAGGYKYLVALSRVAFRDGATMVEEGISAEAADEAHRMLDEHLSPEEGEAVVEVFSSARA